MTGTPRYNHLGVPIPEPRPGMSYLGAYDVWVSDHRDNPFGIQWMCYGARCGLPELVRTRPHLAFEVEDLAAALVGRRVLIAPNSPSPGVLVAFVEEGGEPVELMEMDPAARAEFGAPSQEAPGEATIAAHEERP
jgi:hypothetical protein